jgi:lipopolysaccharide transport system permease protein
MRPFPLAAEAFGRLYRNRALTLAMAKREVTDRYARQVLGSAWAFGHPLIHVLVYIFVFQMVLKLRIETTVAMPMDYVAYLLSGLIPWLAVQEALTKGSTVITSNASLVKQVVFPLEVLPVKSVLVCFVTQGVGTVCLAVYVLATNSNLPWTYALLPVLWFFQALGMIGIVFVLSAVGVHIRDVKELVQVFAVVGIYLVPVVYLPQWVPDRLQWLLPINPFSHMVWCYQDVFYFGRFEHPWSWLIYPAETTLAFLVGYALFRRLRPFLGSAL